MSFTDVAMLLYSQLTNAKDVPSLLHQLLPAVYL
jgi:hypothetical protein